MLWEKIDGVWKFTPNIKYYIDIRERKVDNADTFKYLVEIWKDKDCYAEPIFLIGYYNTMEEVDERIQYVLTNQYADLRSDRNYELN